MRVKLCLYSDIMKNIYYNAVLIQIDCTHLKIYRTGQAELDFLKEKTYNTTFQIFKKASVQEVLAKVGLLQCLKNI